jgi:membrane-associated phospholipid phosphatase
MKPVVLNLHENHRALRWKTYAFWASWVGLAFFTIYPLCNWLTSLRPQTALWRLYLQMELAIPLLAQFVWIYFSMYLLFLLPPFFLEAAEMPRLGKRLIAGTVLAGGIFLLLPSELGFGRVLPTDAFHAAIFAQIFAVDLPFNNMPSLHVIYSALIANALRRSRVGLRWLMWLWLALICLSTVFVHQHHIIDVASALLLVFLLERFQTGVKN